MYTPGTLQRIDRLAAIVLDHLIKEHDRLTTDIVEKDDPEGRRYHERAGINTAIAYMTGAYGIEVPSGARGVASWLPTLRDVVAASLSPGLIVTDCIEDEVCSHEDVEEDDARDGAGGRLRYFCEGCGSEVMAEPNEDGGIDWVLA